MCLFKKHGKEAYWRDHCTNLGDRFGSLKRLKTTLVVGTNFNTEKLIKSRPVDITIQRQWLSVQ